MGRAESDRERAEILVERDEDLAAFRSMSEDLFVARAPVSDPLDRVPSPLKLRLCTGPDASIEQELQAASSVMAG